ncbi:hypothetical protein FB107DRAFT_260241 [Schizophyllum commune]
MDNSGQRANIYSNAMDLVSALDQSGILSSPIGSPSRDPQVAREGETEPQRRKRVKAAERQRRKRERDRTAAQMGIVNFSATPQRQVASINAVNPAIPRHRPDDSQLTPEEEQRRERVRANARERQRKHRMLVKQRKMRELGLDMGNEVLEDPFANGTYPPPPPPGPMPPPHMHPGPMGMPPPPGMNPPQDGQPGQFPPPPPPGTIQVNGGQTFASTLLLSFSCAPLLKQHLLRTLYMTNEELTSLEPLIADAWEQWNRQRRQHYEAVHGQPMPGPPATFSVEMTPDTQSALANAIAAAAAAGPPPSGPPADPASSSNEFRDRFHRSLTVPAPFRSFNEQDGQGVPPPGSMTQTMDPNGPPPQQHHEQQPEDPKPQ